MPKTYWRILYKRKAARHGFGYMSCTHHSESCASYQEWAQNLDGCHGHDDWMMTGGTPITWENHGKPPYFWGS